MGLAGRNFLARAVYSAHFSTEGLTDAEARHKLAAVRSAARGYGAEVANTIPVYLHANPFMQLTPILGPNGEPWKPTHGILPFSKVLQHHADFDALLAEYRERMQKHRVPLNRMLMFFSSNAFIYEPTFMWQDERSIYHRRVYPAELIGALPEHPANPAGRKLVGEIKQRIGELCVKNSPEFRNRLDAWVAFDSLPPAVIARVVDKMVQELADQLASKKVTLELAPAGRAWLAEHGFDRLMGARPMSRLLQNEVKKPLAEKILFGELTDGGHVVIGARDGKLSLKVASAAAPVPLPT